MGSAPDVNQYVPRGPFLTTPVTLRQRKTQSLIVPSSADVLPSSLSSVSYLPGGPRDKSSPDVMSLEEFLAETVKTPNRVSILRIYRDILRYTNIILLFSFSLSGSLWNSNVPQ